tara:strand:+ start:288 stop:530 length:243 start_codon:yes stop_codon:yes gene_type:complete
MNRQEITMKLQGVFREVFDDESIEITESMSANDLEAWDSLNHVRLVVSAEEEFNITLSTTDVADLQNVGQLIDLIEKQAA